MWTSKDFLVPTIKELVCVQENGNLSDPYVVLIAVKKGSLVVGHIPISCLLTVLGARTNHLLYRTTI